MSDQNSYNKWIGVNEPTAMNHNAFKQNARQKLETFWQQTLESARTDTMAKKDFQLPLARIKRLMKVEEEIKMVASEVQILFSKVAEKFVEELTLRAWLNTEENKRRILQKNDLSAAVRTSDVFDFLVYIIPKTDLGSMGIHYENERWDDNGRDYVRIFDDLADEEEAEEDEEE